MACNLFVKIFLPETKRCNNELLFSFRNATFFIKMYNANQRFKTQKQKHKNTETATFSIKLSNANQRFKTKIGMLSQKPHFLVKIHFLRTVTKKYWQSLSKIVPYRMIQNHGVHIASWAHPHHVYNMQAAKKSIGIVFSPECTFIWIHLASLLLFITGTSDSSVKRDGTFASLAYLSPYTTV